MPVISQASHAVIESWWVQIYYLRAPKLWFLKHWYSDADVFLFSYDIAEHNNHFISSCQPREHSTIIWITYSFLEENWSIQAQICCMHHRAAPFRKHISISATLSCINPKKIKQYPDQSLLYEWRNNEEITCDQESLVQQSCSPRQGVSGWGTGWKVGSGTSVELLTSTSTP